MTSGLSSLLVQDQVVSVKTLEQAFRRQVIYGGLLDTNLLELSALEEGVLVQYLARSAGVGVPPAWALERVDPEAMKLIAPAIATERAMVPVQVDGRSLRVVCTEELDRAFLDHLGFTLSLLVEPWVVPEVRLHQALERAYGVSMSPRFQALATKLGPVKRPEGSAVDASRAAPAVAVAPVVSVARGEATAPAPAPAAQRAVSAAAPPGTSDRASAPGARRLRLSAETASLLASLDSESAAEGPAAVGATPETGTASLTAPGVAATDLGATAPAPAPAASAPAAMVASFPAAAAGAAARRAGGGVTGVRLDEARVEWTLSDLTTALGRAASRDEILDAALRYTGKFFQAVALFVVFGEHATAYAGLGLAVPLDELKRTASELARPSFLQRAFNAKRFYLGPAPADDESFALLARLGRKLPRTIFVLPVLIKKRVVALVYGDNDFHQVKIDHVRELMPMAEEVTWAFERLLLARKGAEYSARPAAADALGAERGDGASAGAAAAAAEGKLAGRAIDLPAKAVDAPLAQASAFSAAPAADEARPGKLSAAVLPLVAVPMAATAVPEPPSSALSSSGPDAAFGRAAERVTDPAARPGDMDARALGDALTGSVGWGEPRDVPDEEDRWTAPGEAPPILLTRAPGGASGEGGSDAPGLDHIEAMPDEDSWSPPPAAPTAAGRSFAERAARAGAPVAGPGGGVSAVAGGADGARSSRLVFGRPDADSADSIADAIIAHTTDRPAGPRVAASAAGRAGAGGAGGDLASSGASLEVPVGDFSDDGDVDGRVAGQVAADLQASGGAGGTFGGTVMREPGLDRGDLGPEGPDLFTLIQIVDGAGAAAAESHEKERAIERLVEIGEPALRWLIERFPGKAQIDRLAYDVDDLPPIEECGDLLRAVVRFGYAAVPYLLPLLIRNNLDVRFYATYAFTALPYPEGVKGLLPRLFDTDYRVRRASIRALRGLTETPEFERVREQLLRELRGTHVSRQRNAADAAAAFGFAGSVPALIDVLETGEAPAATAARQALFELTRKDFGDSPRRWRAWWEKNATRDRREWLVEALGDKTRSIREAAIRDLQRVTGHTFGFDPGEGRRVREEAVKRWRDYLDEISRSRSTGSGR
jgi:hypothetical protein